jgi:simple sugar transport system ATP-binding protein
MSTTERDAPVVEVRDIHKRFGVVVALAGVSLRVDEGEVVGLVGDNGAGKSTLMKVLSGALPRDEGEIELDGRPVSFSGMREARRSSIEMVHQGLALCGDLDVATNFFMARPPTRFGLVRKRWMHQEVRRRLDRLGATVQSTTVPVSSLSGGQRQALAVARALGFDPRLLILDEPTAALGVKEAELVLRLIRERREAGVGGTILISHRLQDVLDVCDRVVVLYEGRCVATRRADETSMEELISLIVGKGGRQ